MSSFKEMSESDLLNLRENYNSKRKAHNASYQEQVDYSTQMKRIDKELARRNTK